MRYLSVLGGLTLANLVGMGCAQQSVVQPPAQHLAAQTPVILPTGAALPGGDLVTAQFHVALDPASLETEVTPVRTPQAQPPPGQHL